MVCPCGDTGGTAQPLFHVSARVLPVGHMLRPYSIAQEYRALIHLADLAVGAGPDAVQRLVAGAEWRDLLQRGDHRAEMVLLEAIFEQGRAQNAPRLPSRLDAVFCWRSFALARQFRSEYHPRGVIHRCSLGTGTALVVEAFETADLASPTAKDLLLVEERAQRYWLAETPMAFPEILVRGIVTVEAVECSEEANRDRNRSSA